MDVPILDRDESNPFGRISFNGALGLSHLSDSGELFEYEYGMLWSPSNNLSFQVTLIGEETAPSISELTAPISVTANVPVFDFSRNETVLVDIVSGSNAALPVETRRDLKISLNYKPRFIYDDLRLVFDYSRNRTYDTSQSFPTLTPEIEAAFPDRLTRDPSGRLITIDQRPVSWDRIASSQLRSGFIVSGRIAEKKKPEEQGAEGATSDGQARGGGNSRGGGGRSRFGPGGGGRWNVALFHNYKFEENISELYTLQRLGFSLFF